VSENSGLARLCFPTTYEDKNEINEVIGAEIVVAIAFFSLPFSPAEAFFFSYELFFESRVLINPASFRRLLSPVGKL
jgi:hypothetical protein